MRVVWRARARRDLSELVSYIAKESTQGAARVHDDILSSVSLLTDWPDIGRVGRAANLRELIVPRTKYIVLYRRAHALVTILRIVHAARKR